MAVRAGVDTGGTFTDLVAYDEQTGELRMAKALSTADDPSRAVFDSFARAGLEDVRDRVLRARHDRRDERPHRASRRAGRAVHHRGVS